MKLLCCLQLLAAFAAQAFAARDAPLASFMRQDGQRRSEPAVDMPPDAIFGSAVLTGTSLNFAAGSPGE